jgi:hypothetical protein
MINEKITTAILSTIPEGYRAFTKITPRASSWFEVSYGMVSAYYHMTNDGKIIERQVD